MLASDYTVFCNVSAADRTVTLPDPTTNGGRIYVIKRVGTGNNQCNVTPVAGVTYVLDNGGVVRGITVQSDGALWHTLGETKSD